MVRLTLVPVITLALSDAMKTATLATSSSVMRRRAWVLLATNSCHCSHATLVPLRVPGVLTPFRSVDDVDTAPSGRWAPTNRPVRSSAGVSTGVEVRHRVGGS
jgi:hypothetical protein